MCYSKGCSNSTEKGKAPRKHSMYEENNIYSVLLKIFIKSNKTHPVS